MCEYELTSREAEVARLLSEGLSPREIAGLQSLKLSTVRTHIARARAKLEARSIADLVRVVLTRAARRERRGRAGPQSV